MYNIQTHKNIIIYQIKSKQNVKDVFKLWSQKLLYQLKCNDFQQLR